MVEKNGCLCDECTLLAAVEHGNLTNMIWLKEIAGCSWFTDFAFSTAAHQGSLENMKWMLKNGCPWDDDTFTYAAQHGNLKNMMWLLDNECPWYEETFSAAAKDEKFEIMNWLLKKGCPTPDTILLGGRRMEPWMELNGYGVIFAESDYTY